MSFFVHKGSLSICALNLLTVHLPGNFPYLFPLLSHQCLPLHWILPLGFKDAQVSSILEQANEQ